MNRQVSAVVLAGGYSSRMGQNKAELRFHGHSLLEHQVIKLRSVGIADIVIAGYEAAPEGCRYAPDLYPHRGPLSGIHAGLLAAQNESALVLAVDVPLVPAETLEALLEAHTGGVTMLQHDGKEELLIAVYDRALAGLCGTILQSERTAVRRLLEKTQVRTLPFTGDESLLLNANTAEEYQQLLSWRTEKEEVP